MSRTTEEVVKALEGIIADLRGRASKAKYVVVKSGCTFCVHKTNDEGVLEKKSFACDNPGFKGLTALFYSWTPDAEIRAQKFADELNQTEG